MIGTSNNHNSVLITTVILAFGMLPLYVFPSGAFQPVDIIVIFLSSFVFINISKQDLQIGVSLVGPFIPFIVLATAINSYYTMVSVSGAGYLLSTIQIIYTFYLLFLFSIVFLRILSLHKGMLYMYFCLLIAVLTPLLFNKTSDEIREIYSFNNPNQLGYYALLTLTMLIILNKFARNSEYIGFRSFYIWFNVLIFSLSNVFAVLSLSRACLIGVGLLDLYILFKLFIRYPFHTVSLFILTVITFIVLDYISPALNYNPALDVINRFSQKKVTISDLRRRSLGQFKINNFTALFGSGGRYFYLGDKNLSDLHKGEIHNTILFLFNNYGLFGLIFFLVGAMFFIRRLGHFPLKWYLFLPFVIYNLSHYGLRFRYFWVTIAFLAAASYILRLTHFNSTDLGNVSKDKPIYYSV